MNEAQRRGFTNKGGPRELTVGVNAVTVPPCTQTFSNCVSCPNSAGVTGEAGGPPHQLCHGWHRLETSLDIYWQQVSPSQACTTVPVSTGSRLRAGQCIAFFVDAQDVDGVIVVQFCGGQTLPDPCCQPGRPEGLVRVNRADTVLTCGETGDCAGVMSPNPEPGVCGPTEIGTLETGCD